MGQSWKQIVDEVAGREKDIEAYLFGNRRFFERKSHGAYDGNNDNGELLTESGLYIVTENLELLIGE
jgi:hypothetical protein